MFRAYHLRSDFDQIGWIETGTKSGPALLQALWGMKDNLLDVPTDCPQRDERLGWTGDARQSLRQPAIVCYAHILPEISVGYESGTEHSGGAVPNVVPGSRRDGVRVRILPLGGCRGDHPLEHLSPLWKQDSAGRDIYGRKDWVDYQRKQEEAQGGPHLIKGGFHVADWLALDHDDPAPFGATDPLYIASAYYYRCADIVAQAAEALGYGEARVQDSCGRDPQCHPGEIL